MHTFSYLVTVASAHHPAAFLGVQSPDVKLP